MSSNEDETPAKGGEEEAGLDAGQSKASVARSNASSSIDLRYGAQSIITISIPVSICMILVVATVRSLEFYTDQRSKQYLPYTPFHTEEASSGQVVLETFGNALIVLLFIIALTFMLVIMYKFKCYKLMNFWMILSTVVLVVAFGAIYFRALFQIHNPHLDVITVAIFFYNLAILAVMSVHFKGPLRSQQCFLVGISVLMALTFIKYLPEWTAWALLAIVSVYDLAAVLLPYGPLNMLVKLAQDRNEEFFPALVYTSGMVWYSIVGMSDYSGGGSNSNSELRPSNSDEQNRDGSKADDDSRYNKGIKLGLGDFIFYSILVGKAASTGDYNVVIACFVSVLVGLCLTLVLLSVFKRALPALPVSIALGLIFYFSTEYAIKMFMDEIYLKQALL